MTKYEPVFNYNLSILAGTENRAKTEISQWVPLWSSGADSKTISTDDIEFFTLPDSFSKQPSSIIYIHYSYLDLMVLFGNLASVVIES